MSAAAKSVAATVTGRVACDARSRRVAQLLEIANRHVLKPGEMVRSLVRAKNDGVYPHKDIGEVVVREGDAGIVRERWSFLGEIYYAVEFVRGPIVVIMRGRELKRDRESGGSAIADARPSVREPHE